jgi:hypothetical protein
VVPNLDFLVIETYPQLFGCLLAVAAALVAMRGVFVRLQHQRSAKPAQLIVLPVRATARPDGAPSMAAPQPKRRLNAGRQEFDRLAAYIDDASVRADHVSETQSKAAQKLDTVEVAVNRLLADMDGIMTVARTAPAAMTIPAPHVVAQATTQMPAMVRADRAAPVRATRAA